MIVEYVLSDAERERLSVLSVERQGRILDLALKTALEQIRTVAKMETNLAISGCMRYTARPEVQITRLTEFRYE
jgi:hypothetical protein